MTDRPYDIIVWGATGFVGKLIVEYLAQKYTDSGIKFAVAARNQQKMQAAIDEIAKEIPAAAQVPIIIGSTENFNAIAKQGAVVLSCAGPFADIGEPVVKACVEEGTHYVDTTGEFPWVRKMDELYGEQARAKGLKIVSCCGFDSVPFDLSAFVLQQRAVADRGTPLASIHAVVDKMVGGVSGGTIHSCLGLFEKTPLKEMSAFLDDDYLAKGTSGLTAVSKQPQTADSTFYSKFFQGYSSKFVMTACNAKIVRKSAALCEPLYNKFAFEYREGMLVKNWFLATAANAALAIGSLALLLPPCRWVLGKVVPQGTGPSRSLMLNGYFKIRAAGYDAPLAANPDAVSASPAYEAEFAASGDPGYYMTARMVTEAALALNGIRSRVESTPSKLPLADGFGTPAASLGEEYVERLRAAGFVIDVKKVEGETVGQAVTAEEKKTQ